jgi:segregation and condensation protein A
MDHIFGARTPVVEVEGFSGPFDLLLRLIERGQLDVLAISLAAVADQYLDELTRLQLRDPEHLSAFLVVAAKLLLIKSTLLLPTRPRGAEKSEEAEDPTDLTERLREFRRCRAAADALGDRLDAELRSYPHVPPPYRPGPRPPPEPLDPALLRDAYRRAVRRSAAAPVPVPLGEAPYSVADALAALRDRLSRLDAIRFADLVTPDTQRSRAIATFLAVLEATRLGVVTVAQEERFGEITIRKREVPRP